MIMRPSAPPGAEPLAHDEPKVKQRHEAADGKERVGCEDVFLAERHLAIPPDSRDCSASVVASTGCRGKIPEVVRGDQFCGERFVIHSGTLRRFAMCTT